MIVRDEHSLEYHIAEILYEETRGPLANQRFTEWELKFINDMWVRFFNNPEYELTENQSNVLHKLWEK